MKIVGGIYEGRENLIAHTAYPRHDEDLPTSKDRGVVSCGGELSNIVAYESICRI
jgi:hypothetical protein